MLTFNQLIERAATTAKSTKSHEVNLTLTIDGEKFHAYEANICHREILFLTDKATIVYDVNTIGGRHSALLCSVERD